MDKFEQLNADMLSWKKTTVDWLNNYVEKNGKIIGKAFPGRAAILIKLLGINENHLSSVYEIKDSRKVGHYVPGTKIPILPEAQLYEQDVTQPILNLAWHLPNEVRDNLKKNGYTGPVYDIK